MVEVVGESHGFAALDADDVAADAVSRMGGASRAQEPVRDGQRVRVLAGGHVHIEAADPLLFGNRVDLNHSDAQALMALDGMGASRARAVMAARPFTRPSDLVRARGFGARTAAQLVPLVQTVDPPPPPEPERVRINEASQTELVALPGVGPVLAERIVAERERGGAFTDAADLVRVRGIGPVLSERLAPLVELP